MSLRLVDHPARIERSRYWALIRPEWVKQLRRRGLHPVIFRRSLLFLDREKPGIEGSTVTTDEAWGEILSADRNYRKATNTLPLPRLRDPASVPANGRGIVGRSIAYVRQ